MSKRISVRLLLFVAFAALISTLVNRPLHAENKTVVVQHNHATETFAAWMQSQITDDDPTISVHLCDSMTCRTEHETGRFVTIELKRANRHIQAKLDMSSKIGSSTLFLPDAFFPIARLPGGWRSNSFTAGIVASVVVYFDQDSKFTSLRRQIGDSFFEVTPCLTHDTNWPYDRFSASDQDKRLCREFESIFLAGARNYIDSKNCNDPGCLKNLVTLTVALIDIDPKKYGKLAVPVIKDFSEELDPAFHLLLVQRAMEMGEIDFNQLTLCNGYNKLFDSNLVLNKNDKDAIRKAKVAQKCDGL